MLKDIDFNISYDINSYQDIYQKLMPKIRSYADKYNLTILFVHHLNKLGKTLGSTGFDAVVDGIIRLSKNSFDDNTIKMEIINRDFPDEEEYLHKDKNQVFSIAKDNALEIANPVIVAFVKIDDSQTLIKWAKKMRARRALSSGGFGWIHSHIINRKSETCIMFFIFTMHFNNNMIFIKSQFNFNKYFSLYKISQHQLRQEIFS